MGNLHGSEMVKHSNLFDFNFQWSAAEALAVSLCALKLVYSHYMRTINKKKTFSVITYIMIINELKKIVYTHDILTMN